MCRAGAPMFRSWHGVLIPVRGIVGQVAFLGEVDTVLSDFDHARHESQDHDHGQECCQNAAHGLEYRDPGYSCQHRAVAAGEIKKQPNCLTLDPTPGLHS